MPIICQSINMIDKNFRRLAQDVVMYTPFFWLFTLEREYVAHNPEDWINFVDPNSTTRVWQGFKLSPRLRNWLKLWHPDYDTRELIFARPDELDLELKKQLELLPSKYRNETIKSLSDQMFRLWLKRQPEPINWKKLLPTKTKKLTKKKTA